MAVARKSKMVPRRESNPGLQGESLVSNRLDYGGPTEISTGPPGSCLGSLFSCSVRQIQDHIRTFETARVRYQSQIVWSRNTRGAWLPRLLLLANNDTRRQRSRSAAHRTLIISTSCTHVSRLSDPYHDVTVPAAALLCLALALVPRLLLARKTTRRSRCISQTPRTLCCPCPGNSSRHHDHHRDDLCSPPWAASVPSALERSIRDSSGRRPRVGRSGARPHSPEGLDHVDHLRRPRRTDHHNHRTRSHHPFGSHSERHLLRRRRGEAGSERGKRSHTQKEALLEVSPCDAKSRPESERFEFAVDGRR